MRCLSRGSQTVIAAWTMKLINPSRILTAFVFIIQILVVYYQEYIITIGDVKGGAAAHLMHGVS